MTKRRKRIEMKLIQIPALVAALAVAALAQNTSSTSQKSGPSAPPQSAQPAAGKSSQTGGSKASTPGVGLIVPKNTAHANTAGGKNSSATNSHSVASMPAAKAGAKPTQVSGQKAPVMIVKPAPKQAAKSTPPAKALKKPEAKNTHGEGKSQVKIVQKGAAGSKAKTTKTDDDVATVAMGASNRRDPFLSIIRSLPSSPSGPNCSVGKRCLFIPELELKGIAKDTDGQMMAVVVSNTHRAYFLRENDQVFNGSVQKINSDSVIFREFATDHLGRETAHEVVKRIPKS